MREQPNDPENRKSTNGETKTNNRRKQRTQGIFIRIFQFIQGGYLTPALALTERVAYLLVVRNRPSLWHRLFCSLVSFARRNPRCFCVCFF
jgi:hypothetical protein